jgi:hypothetical protein
MDEIKRDINEIKISQTKMAKDVEYHILRTDRLQDMVTPMWKMFQGVKAVTLLALVIGALKKLGII